MQMVENRLREIFSYDPDTGNLTRRKRTGNRGRVGDVVGSRDSHGYLRIEFSGRMYKIHRLAFLYMLGRLPMARSSKQ
jgi:hypothetical protein